MENHKTENFAVNAIGSSLIEGRYSQESSSPPDLGQGDQYVDPIYGTTITRLSDHDNDGSDSGFVRNYYSRIQAFNADETKIITHAENGFWHIYDIATATHMKKLIGPAGEAEVQWDKDNPDIIYFVDRLGEGNAFYQMNVVTDETTKIADFDDRLPWADVYASHNRYEGSPSEDGKIWSFIAEDSSWDPFGVFLWDKEKDEIVSTFDFAEHEIDYRPDYVTMSPSGDFVIVSWDHGSELGTRAYSTDFSSFTQIHHVTEHSDMAKLANGNDAYVAVDYQATGGMVYYIDLHTGKKVDLFETYLNGTTTALHISGRATEKPGWVLVSTYSGDEESQWFHQKVFAVELAENPRILNIANHHSVGEGYWIEPHAMVNDDFTKLLFNSNWDNGDDEDIDVYMIELPDDAIPDATVSASDPNTNYVVLDNRDDEHHGTDGDDEVLAWGGDDIIYESLGSDKITGGSGENHMVYIGKYEDYLVEEVGYYTFVTHKSGQRGTDTLKDIDFVNFADGCKVLLVLGH